MNSPSGAEFKWRLQMFPNGWSSDFRGYISLLIKLVDSETVCANSRISIGDTKQGELMEKINGLNSSFNC